MQPRKRFGQHWLKNEQILNKIVTAAELKPSDRLLEIGPGTGILTRKLLPFCQTLLSIEIDRDLCKKLVKQFGNIDNFLLLQGDFLTIDLDNYIQAFPKFQNPQKVVANIPYNITGPILEKLLGTIAKPQIPKYELIVLLIQKEVAERLCAKPGTKAYSALSVRVQYLADCELICHVPSSAFYPPPKVDSAVVRIRPKNIENMPKNPQHLDKLLKLGFGEKRKMLRNNLKSLVEREQMDKIMLQFEINPQARAEDISLEQWIHLSNKLLELNS